MPRFMLNIGDGEVFVILCANVGCFDIDKFTESVVQDDCDRFLNKLLLTVSILTLDGNCDDGER